MNLNKVLFAGNLTRDPELRYTSGGSPVCNFSIAVNRYWNDKDSGAKKEETTFMRVTVWGKSGETVAQYFTKGMPIFIEGRLQVRTWETEDGQKRSSVDIVAESWQFVGSKRQQSDAPATIPEDDIPF